MWRYEITGMRNKTPAIQEAAYTLMSKSSLCVAMGTRGSFKAELKSKKYRKTQREREKGRRCW